MALLLLYSQFWPMPSMSRWMINCAKQFLSHLFSRIKSFDQWAVDREPVFDHIGQNWEDSNSRRKVWSEERFLF